MIFIETEPLPGPIISVATRVGRAPALSDVAVQLSGASLRAPDGIAFIASSVPLLVALGSVLPGISAITLFGLPLSLIINQFGVNELRYAVIVVWQWALECSRPHSTPMLQVRLKRAPQPG